MIHALADLLDLLESRRTGKDQKELLHLIREAAGEESCMFEFKVKQIQPTYSDVQEKKYRGGTTVIGELVDDRSEYSEEYVHDQSGQQIELLLPKWCNREVSRWKKGEHFGCQGYLNG